MGYDYFIDFIDDEIPTSNFEDIYNGQKKDKTRADMMRDLDKLKKKYNKNATASELKALLEGEGIAPVRNKTLKDMIKTTEDKIMEKLNQKWSKPPSSTREKAIRKIIRKQLEEAMKNNGTVTRDDGTPVTFDDLLVQNLIEANLGDSFDTTRLDRDERFENVMYSLQQGWKRIFYSPKKPIQTARLEELEQASEASIRVIQRVINAAQRNQDMSQLIRLRHEIYRQAGLPKESRAIDDPRKIEDLLKEISRAFNTLGKRQQHHLENKTTARFRRLLRIKGIDDSNIPDGKVRAEALKAGIKPRVYEKEKEDYILDILDLGSKEQLVSLKRMSKTRLKEIADKLSQPFKKPPEKILIDNDDLDKIIKYNKTAGTVDIGSVRSLFVDSQVGTAKGEKVRQRARRQFDQVLFATMLKVAERKPHLRKGYEISDYRAILNQPSSWSKKIVKEGRHQFAGVEREALRLIAEDSLPNNYKPGLKIIKDWIRNKKGYLPGEPLVSDDYKLALDMIKKRKFPKGLSVIEEPIIGKRGKPLKKTKKVPGISKNMYFGELKPKMVPILVNGKPRIDPKTGQQMLREVRAPKIEGLKFEVKEVGKKAKIIEAGKINIDQNNLPISKAGRVYEVKTQRQKEPDPKFPKEEGRTRVISKPLRDSSTGKLIPRYKVKPLRNEVVRAFEESRQSENRYIDEKNIQEKALDAVKETLVKGLVGSRLSDDNKVEVAELLFNQLDSEIGPVLSKEKIRKEVYDRARQIEGGN